MGLAKPPSAVFCANDVIAIGAQCRAVLGVAVPEKISIVGFDDIPQAAWDVLQLTTVRADLSAMASVAVELLTSRIQDPGRAARHVVLPVELILRATLA